MSSISTHLWMQCALERTWRLMKKYFQCAFHVSARHRTYPIFMNQNPSAPVTDKAQRRMQKFERSLPPKLPVTCGKAVHDFRISRCRCGECCCCIASAISGIRRRRCWSSKREKRRFVNGFTIISWSPMKPPSPPRPSQQNCELFIPTVMTSTALFVEFRCRKLIDKTRYFHWYLAAVSALCTIVMQLRERMNKFIVIWERI